MCLEVCIGLFVSLQYNLKNYGLILITFLASVDVHRHLNPGLF